MFGRVLHFGVGNRDVFPETSAAGKLFSQLAAHIAAIEAFLVRRDQARGEARKLNRDTRNAVRHSMRAIAATGRRAAKDESAPHAFRMPARGASEVTLTAARRLREEAERRKDRFIELGMPETFIADHDAVVAELAEAVAVQQDSRSARHQFDETIDKAFDEGMAVLADLDVTVSNALRPDRVRLAAWVGARRLDRSHDVADVPAADPSPSSQPADPDPTVKVAS